MLIDYKIGLSLDSNTLATRLKQVWSDLQDSIDSNAETESVRRANIFLDYGYDEKATALLVPRLTSHPSLLHANNAPVYVDLWH
jgi:hypothetical protein